MASSALADHGKSVFIVGAFDMGNYGNLLFPLMARFRLGQSQIEVIPVCPTGRQPALADAAETKDLNEMMCGSTAANAIIIGGGNTFHDQSMDFLKEYQSGGVARWASTSLWLGATLAASIRGIPVVWNAAGIPIPIGGARRRALVAEALRAADYVSVRDQGSLETLAAPPDVAVAVVPDTIAELSRMWPRSSLATSFKELLARKGGNPASQFVAIHARTRVASEQALIASRINEFARGQAMTPILVAVGPSLGDSSTLRQISEHLQVPHILLDDPKSLREIAAAVAYSRLYVGASLHAYITSAAYDVPGVLVARSARRKFGGFLAHTGRSEDLVRDWPEAFDLAMKHLNARTAQGMPARVFASLDQHWDRIRATLSNPSDRQENRRVFLRSYLQFGVERDGPAWALQPFIPKAGRNLPSGIGDTNGLAAESKTGKPAV